MSESVVRTNILGFSQKVLAEYVVSLGEPAYRATQLLQWVHQRGVTDFAEMTNLSKSLRQRLLDNASIEPPEVVSEQISTDGTCKWLFKLRDGNCIETVFIPEAGRGTLCVSSQVGCALNCQFCSTATQGFSRNLSTAEIIGQVWLARRQLWAAQPDIERPITNVVMMGMGEPLLNVDAVVDAMDMMMSDFCYGLSKRRVTLSTSGVVPAMKQLRDVSGVALAVSLHAPNDALRNQLVPLNKKYPLKALLPVCRDYFSDEPRRVVTFEYVMLDGVNDTLAHADELATLLRDVPCKVNLIPFNAYPGSRYRCSSRARIDAFRDKLMARHINTITRKTRGDDIDAACGQLVGDFKDRTRRHERYRKTIPIIQVPLTAQVSGAVD